MYPNVGKYTDCPMRSVVGILLTFKMVSVWVLPGNWEILHISLSGGNSHVFGIFHPETMGEMLQFDEHNICF